MFKNRIKGFIIGAIGSVAGLMAMRLYWPKEAALDGTWTAPKVTRVA